MKPKLTNSETKPLLPRHRVLTLHQPWAWFAVHGFKQWETRSWRTQELGPVLIHASAQVNEIGRNVWEQVQRYFSFHFFAQPEPPGWMELPRGRIVGEVTITRVTMNVPDLTPLELMLGDFTPGRWFFAMQKARPFQTPIPARGYQKFWHWSGNVEPAPMELGEP